MQRQLALLLLLLTSSQAFWSLKERQDEAKTEDETDKPRKMIEKTSHDEPVEYGVDVSFPMHHDKVSDNYEWLPHNQDPDVKTPRRYKDKVIQPLGDKQGFYDDFLMGCVNKFGYRGERCRQNERERVAMSLRQPQSMQNYTDVGFKKIKAPEKVWKLIKDFWEKNQDKRKLEQWGAGNTYTNNWESPTYMVSVEDTSLRGGGMVLKQHIWDAARQTIQDWTGEELTQCSLYGIRVYEEGSVLATHVDRLPLVSSAIINVAQDVDEPWPLEVYGHDGKATNVTMEPGDMVLYESHSVLHGRPFPLKGRFYANIFIHFEPTGHSLRHKAKMANGGKHVDAKYKEDASRGVGGHEVDQASDLPSYIIPGTPEETNWRRYHPGGQRSKRRSFATGSTDIHYYAQIGDLQSVAKAVAADKNVVNHKDSNGWTPLHESVRGGHQDLVKYLHENGADINARTGGNGNGGSVLWWAQKSLDADHPILTYLEAAGALSVGPEL